MNDTNDMIEVGKEEREELTTIVEEMKKDGHLDTKWLSYRQASSKHNNESPA